MANAGDPADLASAASMTLGHGLATFDGAPAPGLRISGIPQTRRSS
jgi:hypothetical protein